MLGKFCIVFWDTHAPRHTALVASPCCSTFLPCTRALSKAGMEHQAKVAASHVGACAALPLRTNWKSHTGPLVPNSPISPEPYMHARLEAESIGASVVRDHAECSALLQGLLPLVTD